MKYEITDGQYRDFLNTLSRIQQNARINTSITPGCGVCHEPYVMYIGIRSGGNIYLDATIPLQGPVEFYTNYDGDGILNENTDGEYSACGYLTWGHAAAYLDWSGLRPMSELEFEKACRGIQTPVANEYAWGNSSIASPASYTFSNYAAFNETVSSGYSLTQGNVYYQAFDEVYPLRVGIFADHASNYGRVSSGASYYGIMDITGNGIEYAVTIGNTNGRNYSGQHGDGILSLSGHGNTVDWPGIVSGEITSFSGIGYRGVTYSLTSGLQSSARNYAALSSIYSGSMNIVRGVRTAP
jgi:formylglycine-generating enzyme required for sulfatase activity